MSNTNIEVTPKVSAAIRFLYELLYGTRYDSIYAQPLKRIDIYQVDASLQNVEPLMITHRAHNPDPCVHPKFYARDFALERINWFREEHWDPEKSDPNKYDGISQWYVNLWSGYQKNWFDDRLQMLVSMGLSLTVEDTMAVNSYSIHGMKKGIELIGHDLILLPRKNMPAVAAPESRMQRVTKFLRTAGENLFTW